MPSLDASYPELVAALLGPDQPPRMHPAAEPAWEAVVRAILPRRFAGKDSDRAVAALEAAGLLEPATLAAITAAELRDVWNEAGIAVPLSSAALVLRVARWYSERIPMPGGMRADPGPAASRLREQLLALNGVGPRTADAILLALGFGRFPIDQGTYRILVRHGWCDITADYDEASECLARQSGASAEEIERVSRRLSQVARRFCGARAPRCEDCPLRGLLPESGPIDPTG